MTQAALPAPRAGGTTFDFVPRGQLGVGALFSQPRAGGGAFPAGADVNTLKDANTREGTVVNGGAPVRGEGWASALVRELSNRYIASAFCSWCVAARFCGWVAADGVGGRWAGTRRAARSRACCRGCRTRS